MTRTRNNDSGRDSQEQPATHRRLRRLAVALFLLALLILLAWQTLTSSWFLAPRVESALSRLVGGRVTIGSADFDLDGRLYLTDVRLLVSGVRGAAGELLHVPDVTINLDRGELLVGRLSAQQLIIEDALLRLSEDLDTGRFNVGGLSLGPGGGAPPLTAWPRIELRSGVVQVGEHRGSTFRPSGEIRVNGSLRPEAPLPGGGTADWHAFDLEEIPAPSQSPDSPPGLRLTGRFNLSTGEGSSIISGVSFAPQKADLLPRVAREWWKIIEPSGTLQPIGVQIRSGGRYEIEIAMDGIDWSLPVPSFDPRRDTSPPRMTRVRGSVVIHDQTVDLIGLSGEIDSVRYGLTGSFTSVDRSPGFDLTFDVDQFDLSRNLNMLTALPAPVRELVDDQLVQLGGPSGLLTTRMRLWREAPQEEGAGEGAPAPARPVHASGRVELDNAEGSYREFPYPLTRLRGAVEFNDDEVRIVDLAGRGPTGGQIFVSGRIAPMGPDPSVEVELYANNVPIDEHLLAALGASRGGAVTEFFNPDWMKRLHDARLFLTAADVERMGREVMSLMREHRELTEPATHDEETRDRLAAIFARMEEIERHLNLPVFDLGGRINIRSSIRREAGSDQPTRVSNLISLADRGRPLGLIYEEFPYPARLVEGEVLIDYDRIAIVKDLVLEGAAGGRASLSGEVRRVRQPVRRVEPDLRLRAEAIPMNELLLRAIPGGREHDADGQAGAGADLSPAASILAGLRLIGQASAEGRIFTDERGKADFDIDVRLDAGVARPTEDRPRWEAALAWLWPDTLPLSDAAAHVTVHRRSVDIHHFAGRSGDQHIECSGRVGWAGGPADIALAVQGRGIDLHPHLIDLAAALGSDEGIEEMRRFWRTFDPTGRGDCSVSFRQAADSPPLFDLLLTPERGSLLLRGHRVHAANTRGSLGVNEGRLHFKSVAGEAFCEGAAAGRIAIDGVLGFRPGAASDLHGVIEGGRFESPVFEDFAAGLSRLLAAGPGESVSPRGSFDASFHYACAADDAEGDYLINLQPRELDFTLRGERFEMRRLEGGALITPSAFEISGLGGAYQDGLIRLGGTVDRGAAVNADLQLSVSADRLSTRVRALLPQAVTQLIDAIDLKVGQSVELSGARIRYAQAPDAEPGQPPLESIDFDGLLRVRDASMNVSIPITELDGSLHLAAQRRSDEPWLRGRVAMNVQRMLVLGREVTDVQADLFAGVEPGLVEVSRLVGECYGGRLSAEGSVRVPWRDDAGRYDLRLALAQVAVDPVLRRVAPRVSPAAEGENASTPAREAPAARRGAAAGAAPRPGRLNAALAVAGEFGRPDSRFGRGEISVSDAELYEVPLAMWALQLSALTLPVSTSFREADIDYYIDGNEVIFERLMLDSPAMALIGRGALNYQSQALDMQFNTASKLRAPLLTPLWEAVRDLFMTIRVTGTLERPEAKLQAREAATALRRRPHAATQEPGDLVIAPVPLD